MTTLRVNDALVDVEAEVELDPSDVWEQLPDCDEQDWLDHFNRNARLEKVSASIAEGEVEDVRDLLNDRLAGK